MVRFSQAECELLWFIQDRDGSVSRDKLAGEGPASEKDVAELLLGLEDYLRWDLVEQSGEPVRMYKVVDSVPECSGRGCLLTFERHRGLMERCTVGGIIGMRPGVKWRSGRCTIRWMSVGRS